ncbi:tetratricopeptide repeat protein [Dethiobacter alkaliphilus]|uniref:Tetratricopeptide TPR_2 repeat protein n=1 Tax=Dethiobacter alkaliphilus AHT 1 TaxID=555088 RepID=C0GG36_DETAL|nr:tetratricopeptide repeat protein [Dethiobacter alkaliphilus]EEG77725.1 Tetratricopeptide TPR_2 repeat protein [Dethiobacter alkaliphilus AHT 1]
MSEHVVEQEKTTKKKSIVFWKAASIFLIWILLLGSTGMAVGNRFFWSEVDYGQIQREVDYYRNLVDMEPDDPSHRVALGFNLHRLGDTRGALAHLEEAINIDENLFDAYLNRGYVYTDMGYWDDALADFEKCVELAPDDFKGHFNLGIVYRELDMIEISYESLESALALRPGATDVLYNLALTAQADNDPEVAVHYLERTLQFDPQYQEALDLYRQLTR